MSKWLGFERHCSDGAERPSDKKEVERGHNGSRISYRAIVVALAGAFAVSALWYSPLLFGRQWMALRSLELRDQNLKVLNSLAEEDLDKPTKAPPKGREHEFATFGLSFLALSLHQMLHRSHVTDALRAAGRSAPAAKQPTEVVSV